MNNQHFKFSNRAAYELPHLLVNIGTASKATTENHAQMAEAAQNHAYNANEVIMRGIETIGQMLFQMADDHDNELDRSHLGNLGELVRHLAVEAQYLQETEANMGSIVASYEKRGAKTSARAQ